MPKRPRRLLAALLFAALPACGNVCDRMCNAQADMMERCFPDWETSWEEQSYADREDFLDRCHAVWGDRLQDLDRDDPERASLVDRCERELSLARSDTDCETLLSIEP